MNITPEVIEAFGGALAWLCSCVGALVVIGWRTGRQIQRILDRWEFKLEDHERRISNLERQSDDAFREKLSVIR